VTNILCRKGGVTMTNSRHIAGLLGPILLALSVSEALNLRLLTAEIGPNLVHVIYLNGTLLFVAGLSIVRAHNYWTSSWSVLVTVTGWISMLFGLIRMFAPVSGAELGLDVQRLQQSISVIYAMLIVLLAIGIVLTFKAYTREDSRTA
jgi:NADH:ubiquinone oxidoreductase subunit 6 (subunit J)